MEEEEAAVQRNSSNSLNSLNSLNSGLRYTSHAYVYTLAFPV